MRSYIFSHTALLVFSFLCFAPPPLAARQLSANAQRAIYSLSAATLTACSAAAVIEMVRTAKKRDDLKKAFEDKSVLKRIFNKYTCGLLASLLGLGGSLYCAVKAGRVQSSLVSPYCPSPTQKEALTRMDNPLWAHRVDYKRSPKLLAAQAAMLHEENGLHSTRIVEQLNLLGLTTQDTDTYQAPQAKSDGERRQCFKVLNAALGKTLKNWKVTRANYPTLPLHPNFERAFLHLCQTSLTGTNEMIPSNRAQLPKTTVHLVDSLAGMLGQKSVRK